MEEDSNCEEDNVSRVGARVVAIEPLEAIVAGLLLNTNGEEMRRGGRAENVGMEFAMPLLVSDFL